MEDTYNEAVEALAATLFINGPGGSSHAVRTNGITSNRGENGMSSEGPLEAIVLSVESGRYPEEYGVEVKGVFFDRKLLEEYKEANPLIAGRCQNWREDEVTCYTNALVNPLPVQWDVR